MINRTPTIVGLGIFGLGVVLSAAVFVGLERAEQARVDEQLRRQADNQLAAFHSGLLRYEDKLDSLRAEMAIYGHISRSQFRASAEELMTRFPAIQQVEWIPLVAGADRERIEAQVRAENFPDFAFRDLAGAGPVPLVPSLPAGEYLPVIYTEPVARARAALGFNVLSGRSAPQATRSRTTGLPSLSQPVRLLTGSDNAPGFGLYLPVFWRSETPVGVTREFAGLVLALFRADKLLLEAKRLPSSQGWFDLQVVDQTDPQRPALLGRVTAAGEVQFDQPDTAAPVVEPDSIRQTAQFWGRTWEFTYAPHPGAPGLPRTQQPMGVLLVGLIASMAFGLLGYTRSDRTAKIEREVITRTAELARAQELLRASSAERAQVFERIADAFVALDRNWRYTFVNAKAGAIFGRRPEDLVGKHIWTEFPEMVGQPIHAAYEKAMAEQQPIFLEEHYTPYDKWFENRIYPSPEGVSIYFYDISERKLAEIARAQSETMFRALVDNSLQAIVLFHGYQVTFVNRAYCEITGYSLEESQAQTVAQRFEGVHPDDRARVIERQAKFERGEAVEGTDELRILRKDGEMRWVLTSTKSFTLQGRPARIGIMVDITARKQAEQARERSEAEQRRLAALQTAILDALPAHIALLDPEGAIVAVNEAWRRFGAANVLQSTDFCVGQNYLRVCEQAHGECAEEAGSVAEGIRRVLRGEASEFHLEYPCHSPTEKRWFRLMVTQLVEGQRKGAVVTHVSVTPRKLAEEAMLSSEREQRQLAAALEAERGRLVEAQAVAKVGSWETNLADLKVTWSAETHRIFETDPTRFTPTHPAFLGFVHPEDREKVEAAFANSLSQESVNTIEHRIIMPDSRIKFIEERWRIIRDGDGRPVRAAGTCQDITVRKRAEAETIRLWNVLEASLNEIYIFDAETLRFNYVNECARRNLGYSMVTMRAMTPVDIKPDFTAATFGELVGPLRRHEQEKLVFETRHRRADGSDYPVEVHLQLVERDERTVFLAVINDITVRKRAETELLASREQLRALLARLQRAREEERIRISREIHDELGQLLTGLKMDTRWLERKLSEPGLPPALNPLLERAVGASELADTAIAAVQKIAAELRPGPLNRLGLPDSLRQEAREFADRAGLRCTVDTPEPELDVPAEIAGELFYICREALTNVARHAHAANVEIRLRAEADAIVLEVRDDGVGMSEQNANNRTSLGVLGMKERAAQHGGTVSFTRNEPYGTRVMVRIPTQNDSK